MKTRWLLVALLSLSVALAAGCGGGGNDGPFVGSWVSEGGVRITFTSDTWFDSDGDSGTYSFTGEYPLFTLTMDTATRRFLRRATFADVNTFEMCFQSASGDIGSCVNLVIDRPTLH